MAVGQDHPSGGSSSSASAEGSSHPTTDMHTDTSALDLDHAPNDDTTPSHVDSTSQASLSSFSTPPIATSAPPATVAACENVAVITDCPNAANAAQWFYKPYLQPSSISTTATSSFMPTSALFGNNGPTHGHSSAATYSDAGGYSSISNSHDSFIRMGMSEKRGTEGWGPGTSISAVAAPSALSAAVHLPARATLYATLQSSMAAGTIVGPSHPSLHPSVHAAVTAKRTRDSDHGTTAGATLPLVTPHLSRTAGPYSSTTTGLPYFPISLASSSTPSPLPIPLGRSFHLNPQPPAPIKKESIYHNPYRAPSHTNSRAFLPPWVPGYEFTSGSQAGNMGLMMGKRIKDGVLVTGKLHQSRVLLQHEYRILKRLQIANARYLPEVKDMNATCASATMGDAAWTQDSVEESIRGLPGITEAHSRKSTCEPKPGMKRAMYEAGCVETEKYFNRVVEDFIDLEQEDMSILILERLGPNLLSHTHHQLMGLEGLDGLTNPEALLSSERKKSYRPQNSIKGSPFPDVKTFLIFALKAASILEALLSANLAHLAICPTALHWMPAQADAGPWSSHEDESRANEGTDTDKDTSHSTTPSPESSSRSPHVLHSLLKSMDINETKLRLFDFTHSKILSHERARAPNNIVEWQIPGYLEYHLQFLAPEQTGRAETWMDHRTDIYGLGATLFSLLTMQYPNTGQDSVQILQGVLSRDLPPLGNFRPDMPPIIDAILRKMTQKQPSQRYQNAFGFKQDILLCLNALHKTGTIDSFELGKHDISYQFVLPTSIYGRHPEQQMISAAIAQAASAYQQSLTGEVSDDDESDDDGNHDGLSTNDSASSVGLHSGGKGGTSTSRGAAVNNADFYVFEDDIVSLKSQVSAKIPLSSKTLLRTSKPFLGVQSIHKGHEATDPIVRVVFVSGPSGVGKTMLIRGMATTARNSGLFAGGVFEADGPAPYSAILHCIQSVLQQLLAQNPDAIASLFVAIRTAFEPSSGIGIICDLVPELKHFFSGSEMPESLDVPLTHSVARFHALILKLIRVISTHFFMTWLIDDLQFADENSIDLLATLVNVNKRLPIVLIITHRDTPDCLLKVKHILGGGNVVGGQHPTGFGALGAMHHDTLMDNLPTGVTGSKGGRGASSSSSNNSSIRRAGGSSMRPVSKSTALRGTGVPMVVRGGGGVRFIRLQHPTMDTIQGFLSTLLHREKPDVAPLASVLQGKSWMTIRQLVLELYRNHTIYFNCVVREWEWEPCSETLAEIVRKLTGEEYAFLDNRFRGLDCNTKKALICASICGPSFTIQDLQSLVSGSYTWTTAKGACSDADTNAQATTATTATTNKGCSAMAGIQTAIREGILVYTSVSDHLRFQHGIMRRVAVNLLDSPEMMEKLHFEMIRILFSKSGEQHEFRIASHVLQSLELIKKKLAQGARTTDSIVVVEKDHTLLSSMPDSDLSKPVELDTKLLRKILSLAGEKSQKSGAQDMALAYWNAALSLLPVNCWDRDPVASASAETIDGEDVLMANVESTAASSTSTKTIQDGIQSRHFKYPPLYHEALKLHLQCIEAERWRENFDQAMKICDIVLSKVTDVIDRARVYEHQIEMSVWAYSSPEQAVKITVQCLVELGMDLNTLFNPSEEEMRSIFDETHKMLLAHMPELQANPRKICTDPNIAMMMEVLNIASASLYYCNVPFMASTIVQSVKLTCKHGITKDAGRALVSFALTYSTWYGCLDNAYELGRLACDVSNGNHHVKFLFYLVVQQWGEHIAHSIPALEETLTAVDLTCDRLFNTAGMIHVSVMKVLLGRVHLNDLMSTTIELLAKHIEFGSKSHGVEVMQGILQMIKCLKGRTLASNPETIFEDVDFSDTKGGANSSHHHTGPIPPQNHSLKSGNGGGGAGNHGRDKKKKTLTMVHNNSTYTMLKVVAAFIFGHYNYIQEVTDVWHDDPKSIMNFEGSWIAHSVFTVVGLALVNVLRTEQDMGKRRIHKRRLFDIRARMELRGNKYPTNHAAMLYLLEAEIADQGLTPDSDIDQSAPLGVVGAEVPSPDMKKVLLLYERAIKYSIEGDFPLHKCLSYELAAKCHLRHGLVTSARCLMANACKVYQNWGAKGKVQWFHRTYPEMFPASSEVDPSAIKRGLFYRPTESSRYATNSNSAAVYTSTNGVSNFAGCSAPTGMGSGSGAGTGNAATAAGVASGTGGASSTSPWMAASPNMLYSPPMCTNDAVSAAAAAMAESNLASAFQNGCPSATSSSSSTLSAPLYSLQNTWLSSPQSPEMDNADLDVLDFSSVIEAMQVIASEIDLDLLLVKSLGVLNQSVGAKHCCVIIYKDQELVLSASLGDSGRCESVNPPLEVERCQGLFHGVINYVVNTSAPCLLTNAKDDPRFCADEYLKQHRVDLKTVLCAPILHKNTLVGVLYMEDFPERAFANKRMLVMNLLVQQLGISITNALLYQSVLQSESKLNGLLENMPCGIALWDSAAENCMYINSTWSDMTGYTHAEIMSTGCRVLVHPDEIVQHGLAWKERVQAGMPCQWECRYGLKDGTFRWGIIRMLPIKATAQPSKVLQWLTVTIDIDDQRRAVQLKSNFLANMSHELRTPFSGILGMLSLLRDSSGLSHEQFEFVDMAKASCEMLIRIVDDLLNFSKLEADKVTLEYIPLCFEEILGDVCDLLVPLASRKGLELIILVDDTLPVQLIGDPDRIKQILMNLIGNAIKFSTSGNVVIKYWHKLEKRENIVQKKSHQSVLDILTCKRNVGDFNQSHMEQLRSKAEREMLMIQDQENMGDEVDLYCSVTDQGIGMTPEEQKMLFVSFQQTDNGTTRKYGGTGLGLSICAQLIAHMRGKVVVESEKGHGSTFTFSAKVRSMTKHDREQNPAESARIKECEKVLSTRWESLKGKRVLILSPNKMLRLQILNAVGEGAECMEFDDVVSAVDAGAIGILGDPLGCCAGLFKELEVVTTGDDAGRGCSSSARGGDHLGPTSDLERICQFDFILVDHVLDSAELDCIYPSPCVAFVLLLAPTTETLRWILPPAERRQSTDADEADSGQVDVGGRGRIPQSSEMDFAAKAMGQVRSATYLSKLRQSSAKSTGGDGQPVAELKRVPSQLFKRKKNSIQAAASLGKRTKSSVACSGSSVSKDEAGATATTRSAAGNAPSTSSFQVCRMIKPVRRLKLLQIMYNALMQHEHKLSGAGTAGDGYFGHGSIFEIDDESDSDNEDELDEEDRDKSSPSISTGKSSSARHVKKSLLKRRRNQGSEELGGGDDLGSSTSGEGSDKHCGRANKTAKVKVSSSSSPGSDSGSRSDRAATSVKARRMNRKALPNPPKRARNNDALTLLLTHEERKRCKGKNVLVAEDDFVSQKILEKQLSKLGMNVMIANNGQEAVDQWLAVERGHYTIAIFDHHMPIMDGLAATKKLRSLEAQFAAEQEAEEKMPAQQDEAEGASRTVPNQKSSKRSFRIPIVGLSADIQLATKEKCIKAGMDEYMTKPLLTQGLALLIQRYCCD
ncbi:hypothetical protein EDD11_003666 [Mortierella claussenii]|nr:hypothetical protein EDD11_003666 [Mortierella claussenii]